MCALRVHLVGTVLVIASIVWYIGARALVYRHFISFGLLRSSAIVSINFVLTTVFLSGATFVLLQAGQ